MPSPNRHKRWTPEDDRRLETLLHEGADLPAAAEALGRTEHGVRNRAERLGLIRSQWPSRPWTPEEEARLQDLRETGLPWREVAKRLGRSSQACMTMASELRARRAAARAAEVARLEHLALGRPWQRILPPPRAWA